MKRYLLLLILFLATLKGYTQNGVPSKRTYEYDDLNRLSKVPISGMFTAGQSVSVTYTSTGGMGNVSLELVSCAGTV